jgi:hypothetical protein
VKHAALEHVWKPDAASVVDVRHGYQPFVC